VLSLQFALIGVERRSVRTVSAPTSATAASKRSGIDGGRCCPRSARSTVLLERARSPGGRSTGLGAVYRRYTDKNGSGQDRRAVYAGTRVPRQVSEHFVRGNSASVKRDLSGTRSTNEVGAITRCSEQLSPSYTRLNHLRSLRIFTVQTSAICGVLARIPVTRSTSILLQHNHLTDHHRLPQS
jgi:hypothetical protein